jgi:hypothetical protein
MILMHISAVVLGCLIPVDSIMQQGYACQDVLAVSARAVDGRERGERPRWASKNEGPLILTVTHKHGNSRAIWSVRIQHPVTLQIATNCMLGVPTLLLFSWSRYKIESGEIGPTNSKIAVCTLQVTVISLWPEAARCHQANTQRPETQSDVTFF